MDFPKKSVANYSVFSRKDNRLIINGGAKECCRAIGVSYGSFLTLCSRSKKGSPRSRYYIMRTNPPKKKEALSAKPPFPCTGCMNRVYCDHTGEYCTQFSEWFSSAYDEAAYRIQQYKLVRKR